MVQNLGGVDKNGNPRQVLPGLPAGSVANAQVVLNKAADAAQKRPATVPGPNQWIYTEVWSRSLAAIRGKVSTPTSPQETRVDHYWTRADGRRRARLDHGKLVVSPTGPAPFPDDYAALAKLPRDPDALLAWARNVHFTGSHAGPDDTAWAALNSVLMNGVLPPELEAAIYRAMAKIPNVTVNKAAVDEQGRPAIGLTTSVTVKGEVINNEILLAPATYTFRGERIVEATDRKFPSGYVIKKGTIESQLALLTAKVVDKPGQR